LCNSIYPALPSGSKTRYVTLTDNDRKRLSRYPLYASDLTDAEHPWRHDPGKLARSIFAAAADLIVRPMRERAER
jgi:hypothetical protein